MTDDPLIARIERTLGAASLVDALARLPGSDLQSLLLAVHRRRVASRDAAGLLREYRANRFVQPSPTDAAALREVERTALALLPPGFEALDLSPVAPFGTSAVLGAISQDWVPTSGRNTEVVSDPTAVFALIEERIIVPLARKFARASFGFDRERHDGQPGYYVRTWFKVWRGGVNLADGGFVDWSECLLGDREERLLTSGLGTEGLIS